ncbi:hypothetical protein [Microvirga sp. 17 mud 1-3]|uniref:hypothetical protein n=1 Tax=Microvirga sp. 17 mud 1-3 TaxID=2082949 RepID=UPI000D6C921B|nr:hypothetical protein [Microvirga sp. 17 mud 1-3]AWM87283.1 hypothetical protein C4E04_11430 [Microvirga sp. 17 mud 1-3]
MSKPPLRASPAPSPADTETSGAPGIHAPTAETAQYIAEFTAELSFLARRSNLDLLAYLLDMARLEATRAVQGSARRG